MPVAPVGPSVYFAGADRPARVQMLLERGVDTILIGWRGVARPTFERMAPLLVGKRVILDPGYGTGGEPTEYAAFAKEYVELFQWCLAWDVPGGGALINTHWWLWSGSVGIPKLVGVFHPGMPWRFMAAMQSMCGRVAFGSLKMMPVKQRIVYLDEAFYAPDGSLRVPGLKAHGLGMDDPAVVSRYPWDSVDSTSWMRPIRFGEGGTISQAISRQGAKGAKQWHPVGRQRFLTDAGHELGHGARLMTAEAYFRTER